MEYREYKIKYLKKLIQRINGKHKYRHKAVYSSVGVGIGTQEAAVYFKHKLEENGSLKGNGLIQLVDFKL